MVCVSCAEQWDSRRVRRSVNLLLARHCDDDIALFSSCIDIPVSVSNLFQWIVAINDRPKRSHLNKLKEEGQVLILLPG
jgi:hypothetical protein